MGSGRRRRSIIAVLIAAATLAALVPGRSIVLAYSAPIDAKLSKQIAAKPAAPAGSFVHFTKATPFLDGVERVTSNGLKIGYRFPSANTVFAYGSPLSLQKLRADTHIARLEFPGKIPVNLQTATWATRARSLYQQTGGLDLRVPAPGGGFIDGTGSGVAVVDSGIDATNPDLDWCGDGPADTCKTVLNFKVECSTPVFIDVTTGLCFGPTVMQDVADSDTTAGHGTHVAGIAAGTGGVSKGLHQGVAPGAKLYGFGVGDGRNIFPLNAAGAYQWIIDHHADPLGNGTAPVPGAPADPPIVVVNNSYGAPTDYSPDDLLSQLADAAIAQGITVVWSAGNSGGSGGRDCTDTLQAPVPCTGGNASGPMPGNISVANYDDGQTGSRDNVLSSDSSRGIASDDATWPDISAPGSLITSTCPVISVICLAGTDLTYPPYYGSLSGTSMAAPHVSGIVALLHQANPAITPAQVEDILQDTAHKFTAGAAYAPDSQNPGGTSSFDKGAGLADARLAVLRTLGLPDDAGVGAPAPLVSIDDPVDGSATVPASFTASGSATSPVLGGSAPVLADETGVLDHVVGSVDLQTLQLSEPAAGQLEVRYTVQSDAGAPPTGHSYDLFYALESNSGRLSLSWDPTTNTMACRQVVFTGTTNITVPLPGCVGAHPAPNTFTLTFPVADILPAGTQLRGAVIRSMWAASYVGVIQDQLPGGIGSSTVHPERAEPYVFSGAVTPSTDGIVTVSLDAGDPVEVASGTGTLAWSQAFGPLAPGSQHTLTAVLDDGGTVVSDASTFTIEP